MNSSPPPFLPGSQAVSAAGPFVVGDRPSRRSLILEVRELFRQGDPRPVETVLSRHPEASQLESLVFDLIHEEYHQRCRDGKLSDAVEFNQRFSAWGIDFEDFLAAKDLLENHRDRLTECVDLPALECLRNFQVLAELGRGSFAQVYLALEPALGHRPVVLKVSRNGVAEANTLGRLDHPHIVPVYSVHHDPNSGMTVVCMPYLGSATLEDVAAAFQLHQKPPRSARMIWQSIQDPVADLQGSPAPSCPPRLFRGSYVNAVLYLGRKLAEALAFVHEQGILHRDLKPSNVLMTSDGRPMLLDFNLSRHKQLPDHKAAGTIVYMPPELLAGFHPDHPTNSPVAIDERADVFSLGVILYELSTGAYPFGSVPRQKNPREAAADWFEKQKAGPFPIRLKNRYLDMAAAQMIERCLAFEPKDRPASAHELATGLRQLGSPMGRARRWASLHGSLLLMATILGLAGLAVGTSLVISKEPYGVRQLHLGWDLYHQGHYEEAIQYLNRSIEGDRTAPDAIFARARSFQRLGRLESAIADFQAADKLAEGKDGRIKAGLGYSLSLRGFHEQAVVVYSQAWDLDFETAEVLNNLGYGYIMWNAFQTRPNDCLDRAEECLTKAIKLNDKLQPAYYNRARLAILKVGRDPRKTPDQGLADIRKAIELGPVTAPLLWDAGRLAWLTAVPNDDPRQAALTLDYLNEAIDCGLNPKQLEADFIFHSLKKDRRFQALIQRPHLANQFQNATKLVDPILD